MRYGILHLRSPLTILGAEKVDRDHQSASFPGHSMLTGLISNALGLRLMLKEDRESMQSIQDRMTLAVREDSRPSLRRDYTVSVLKGTRFWTTRGVRARRRLDNYKTMVHRVPLLQDGAYTVAFTLDDADTSPTLDQCFEALESPARPLYIGRKCCIPSRPLWQGVREASTPHDALPPGEGRTWVPLTNPKDPGAVVVHDRRDWINHRPVGRSFFRLDQLDQDA